MDTVRHESAEALILSMGDAVRTRIVDALRDERVALAVVYGSRARGAATPESDLDVGVLSADGQPLSYAAMGAIARDLSMALSIEVDVSDLSTPDAVFRYEVARCARLLFEDQPHTFTGFLAKAMIDYSDIERFLPELVAGVARGPRATAEVPPPNREKTL